MGDYNTIILKKGYRTITKRDYKKFSHGDTFIDADPEILGRWSIDQEEKAKTELAKYKCETVEYPDCVEITEYALEYFETDKDGEFISGSDLDFAESENMINRM